MNLFIQMLNLQLTLLIYLLIGVVCYRLKIISKSNRKQFISFILNILMPCMVFDSFKNVTTEILKEGIYILFISLMICFLTSILGKYLYKNSTKNRKKIMRYGTLINNAGFAGLPIVGSLYGNQGLILASIFLIPIRIFMWSAGITMLSNERQKAKQVVFQLVRNPSIIAVILGLLRGMLRIQLPYFLDNSIEALSSTVSPMAMIVVGSVIATIKLKGLIEFEVIYFSIVRLIIIPSGVLIVLSLLKLNREIIGISTILTAMPAATTTALLAAEYNLDEIFASKLVFVTTIGSIITSPIFMLLI